MVRILDTVLEFALNDEIKVYYLYIYCALTTTSKLNFEPLFNFIKIFKEYLKQPICIQNSLKTCASSFPAFTATREG